MSPKTWPLGVSMQILSLYIIICTKDMIIAEWRQFFSKKTGHEIQMSDLFAPYHLEKMNFSQNSPLISYCNISTDELKKLYTNESAD